MNAKEAMSAYRERRRKAMNQDPGGDWWIPLIVVAVGLLLWWVIGG